MCVSARDGRFPMDQHPRRGLGFGQRYKIAISALLSCSCVLNTLSGALFGCYIMVTLYCSNYVVPDFQDLPCTRT